MGGIKSRASRVALIQVQGLYSTLQRIGVLPPSLLASIGSIPNLQPYLGPANQQTPLASLAAVKPEPGAAFGKALANEAVLSEPFA